MLSGWFPFQCSDFSLKLNSYICCTNRWYRFLFIFGLINLVALDYWLSRVSASARLLTFCRKERPKLRHILSQNRCPSIAGSRGTLMKRLSSYFAQCRFCIAESRFVLFCSRFFVGRKMFASKCTGMRSEFQRENIIRSEWKIWKTSMLTSSNSQATTMHRRALQTSSRTGRLPSTLIGLSTEIQWLDLWRPFLSSFYSLWLSVWLPAYILKIVRSV